MKLSEIARLFNCNVEKDIDILDISIDSRCVKPSSLFIAIKGENFDGHDFIDDAIKNGAVAVISNKDITNDKNFTIVVDDTIKALGVIAKYHRSQFNCATIALTGSNGKTSVKEMIASILPHPSFSSYANYNNHIGLPLNVLQLNSSHRYAVFELGANHQGEIAYTVDIVKPNVTLINNIGPAHLEGFKTLEGVARAKGEIYQGLSQDGCAVLNLDDKFANFWDDILLNKKVLSFSLNKTADITANEVCFDALGRGGFVLRLPTGSVKIQLQVPGIHNVYNALAAASCAQAVGIDPKTIEAGLNNFQGVKGRMFFKEGKNHSIIIDDTYNANLRSVCAALEVLAKYKGKKIFVFADMGELGDLSEKHHKEVGLKAKELDIDLLLTFGKNSEFAKQSFGVNSIHFNDKRALTDCLLNELNQDTTVLVKGSRSQKMEQVVNQLLN